MSSDKEKIMEFENSLYPANYYLSQNPQEAKSFAVLMKCLFNNDFSNITNYALKVLEINPENVVADMLYDCEFSFYNNNITGVSCADFFTLPVTSFFRLYKGQINIEFSTIMFNLLKNRHPSIVGVEECGTSIIENVEALKVDESEKERFFNIILDLSSLNHTINMLQNDLNHMRGIGMKTFILTDNEYLAAGMDGYKDEFKDELKEFKEYKELINKILKNKYLNSPAIPEESKKQFIKKQRKEIMLKVIPMCLFLMLLLLFMLFIK